MAMIIEGPREHERTETKREYRWTGSSAGFSFDVNPDGSPVRTEGNAHNIDKLPEWVASGELVDLGVQEYTHRWRTRAILRCDCGEEMELDSFTNTCDCGADYNQSGQRLGPRTFWGEETGEHLADILNYR